MIRALLAAAGLWLLSLAPGPRAGVPESVRPQGTASLFPSVRGLFVQLWLVRVNADLRAGSPIKALRHARELLAFAPDFPAARAELAEILAYDLAALELDPVRRMAWIAEGLAVLDAGIARDPGAGALHQSRGFIIWQSAEHFPEFAAAFERTHGTSALEEAVEALLRGAEVEPGVWGFARRAAIALEVRGNVRLAAGAFAAAARDFERSGELSREVAAFAARPSRALALDLEYAAASAELARLSLAGEGALPRAEELRRARDRIHAERIDGG